MKKKQIQKAMKSDTPINSMYALIPEKRREAFKRFAAFWFYRRKYQVHFGK